MTRCNLDRNLRPRLVLLRFFWCSKHEPALCPQSFLDDRARLISGATDLRFHLGWDAGDQVRKFDWHDPNPSETSLRDLVPFGGELDVIHFMWSDCLVN